MTASEIAKHVQIVLDLREKEDSLLWHGAAAAVLRLVGDLEGDELEARVEELLDMSETELQAGPHVTLEGRRIFVDYSNDDGNCAWTTFEDLCVQALRLDGDLADWQDGIDALPEKDREAAEDLGDALLYPADWLVDPEAATPVRLFDEEFDCEIGGVLVDVFPTGRVVGLGADAKLHQEIEYRFEEGDGITTRKLFAPRTANKQRIEKLLVEALSSQG